jgi:hypothetical protein
MLYEPTRAREPNLSCARFLSIFCFLVSISILRPNLLHAEQIPVRHLEGVTFGFLVLQTEDGTPIAYGDLQQVTKGDRVTDDMTFHFSNGSFYEEITVFTQRGKFHLLTDQVVQKGPSFKDQLESWFDVSTGQLTVRYSDGGKQKQMTKHLDLPDDVANGLLLTLIKNIDPRAPVTTVSMVVASSKPRVVELDITPQDESVATAGFISYKTQEYLIKARIGGVAGAVAPLVGKKPPDMRASFVKSEAPSLVEFEGPLYAGGPVWRIELNAPKPQLARLGAK